MSESSIGERKRALRSAALSQRKSLASEDAFTLGGLAQARALQFKPYIVARAVTLYGPIQNEVPTERIRDHALTSGKKVFYPKLAGANSVALAEIHSAADLGSGRFGIAEPIEAPARLAANQDGMVVFLPGLVFDALGNRLGRGIGWYDRLLKKLGKGAVFVALAYEFQIIDTVPTEAWDEKVDYVITEKRVIDCGGTPSRATAVSEIL
jgi:5-formyltetrahydrofolate cyclo-ligase